MADQLYHPATDGVDHINIYTKGRTRLGRLLTNLAELALEHPVHGYFRTAEGFYYYLTTGLSDERYRVLNGFDAKRVGSQTCKVWNSTFCNEFQLGLVGKIELNEELKALLIAFKPELPFTHYYHYGKGDNLKIVVPKGHVWQIDFWTRARKALIDGTNLLECVQ
ncbi:hypothetical protein ACLPJK_25970 [Pseudomonas aeruginosa]|uniref:hypothetical protein n=1 Tax=Pseudomonas aeruginosa TaxID=287 RepID=UPI003D2BBE9C